MRSAFIAVFFLLSVALMGHSVNYRVEKGGVTVYVWYEGLNPEPMRNAFVKVFSPGSDVEFQKGRTDQNGRFSFFPDKPGRWQVVINDGRGHGLVVDVEVDKKLGIIRNCYHQPFWMKFLTGLSLIFGFFGLMIVWRDWKGLKS